MEKIISFAGEVSAVVDANSRVALPSTFRDILENERRFYLVKGKRKSLIIFREDDFNKIERPKLLALTPEERLRASSNSQFIILDERQNRFLLSEKFKAHAEIEKDIVFVGDYDKIRIYNANNYKELMKDESIEDYEYGD